MALETEQYQIIVEKLERPGCLGILKGVKPEWKVVNRLGNFTQDEAETGARLMQKAFDASRIRDARASHKAISEIITESKVSMSNAQNTL